MGWCAKEWLGAMCRWQSVVRGWVGVSQREADVLADKTCETLHFKLTQGN